MEVASGRRRTPAAAVAGGDRPRSSLEMISSELGAQWRAILAGARASISIPNIGVGRGGGPGAHMSTPIAHLARESIFSYGSWFPYMQTVQENKIHSDFMLVILCTRN